MGRVTRTQFGCCEVTVLTDAQILALPNSTPTVVQAIPGRVIQPYLIAYVLSPWIADYTVDVTANLSVNTPTLAFAAVTNLVSVLLAAGQAAVEWCDIGREFDFIGYNYADLVGQPLQLITTNNGGNPDFTGGGAGSILTVHTFFNVI